MSDTFLVNVKFGVVEPEIRYVPFGHGLKCQSRRIERDRDGVITLISDWQDLSTITFGRPERAKPWWSRWLLF